MLCYVVCLFVCAFSARMRNHDSVSQQVQKKGTDDIRARRQRAPEVSVGAGCITVIELIMQQHTVSVATALMAASPPALL